MTGDDFRFLVRASLSTVPFAWLQMRPELLQTYHQLALDSAPSLSGIRAPLDAPVHDLILNTETRPSQMQAHLLDTVVPVMLVAIQSLAEDALEDRYKVGYLAAIFDLQNIQIEEIELDD